MFRVQTYLSLDALPSSYAGLFETSGRRSFLQSEAWFRNLIATTSDPGDTVRLYGVETTGTSGDPVALFIARVPAAKSAVISGRTLAGFTSPFTTQFGLILADDVAGDAEDAIAHALAAAIHADKPRWVSVRIDALDQQSTMFRALVAAFRATGMPVQPYFQFGNWYENTDGRSFDTFKRQLPKGMRQLRNRLERPDAPRFELICGTPQVDAGIAAYERIYALSWKVPEPYPAFTPGLIRAAAEEGCLRLGLLFVDDEPAAVQVWLVGGAKATIFKVAHDDRFKQLSVGSMLTVRLMEHVIDVDRVVEIDFGRGDDPYKKMWLPKRRERWGFVAFNPRTGLGALGALRHVVLGKLVASARGRLAKVPASPRVASPTPATPASPRSRWRSSEFLTSCALFPHPSSWSGALRRRVAPLRTGQASTGRRV